MTEGVGRYANPRDGDVIEFHVEVIQNTVAVKSVDLRCCHSAMRSADELAAWSYGKTPEDAARIEPRELIARLSLAEDEERCALTAIAALRAALVDAHVKDLE
ncbi:MAG TPA: iron-sulfur cluster assembly scaffold protein [Candidatus Limnocylindrales bacterium]|nr:iron-sulfur cluster assembly scaffold protein [Candidatus Limnocylindrales bacterium]